MHHVFEDEANVYILMEHFDSKDLYLWVKQLSSIESRVKEEDVASIFS